MIFPFLIKNITGMSDGHTVFLNWQQITDTSFAVKMLTMNLNRVTVDTAAV